MTDPNGPIGDGAIIETAQFNPRVCHYWLISGTIILTLTVVGIPLLPIWLVLGLALTRKYLDRMRCVLTERSLEVRCGLLVRVEKTVPLEKITDMGMVQGPIMRAMELHTLTVETAGQSGAGALVRLTGIVDAPAFRQKVLEQRDRIAAGAVDDGTARTTGGAGIAAAASGGSGSLGADAGATLTEIRDILRRIESSLDASDRRGD